MRQLQFEFAVLQIICNEHLDLISCKRKGHGVLCSREKTLETRNKFIPDLHKRPIDKRFLYSCRDGKGVRKPQIYTDSHQINILESEHCVFGSHSKYQSRLDRCKNQNEKLVKCTPYKYPGKSLQVLNKHMDHHYKNKKLICSACNYECFTSNQLTPDKTSSLACSRCDYKCKTLEEMNMHLKRHANQIILKCKNCSYTCFARSQQNHHSTEHTTEYFVLQRKNQEDLGKYLKSNDMEVLKCDYCDCSFFKFDATKKNNRKNTLKQIYKCVICGYYVYKMHDYIINSYKNIDDSGILVFSCKYCNFKTPLKSCFKRHLNISHKKKRSDSCSRFLADLLSIKDREGTSEKVFSCAFCSFKESSFCRIRDHIVIKHRLTYVELKAFECDKIVNCFVNSKSNQRSLEQLKQGDKNYCLLTWSFFKHHVCKIHDYMINSKKSIDGSVMQVFSCINCDFKDKFQMRCIVFPEGNKFYCSCNYSFMGGRYIKC